MSGADADDGFLARWAKRKAKVQGGLADPAKAPPAALSRANSCSDVASPLYQMIAPAIPSRTTACSASRSISGR